METRTASAKELTLTFIHGTDSKCPGREKRQQTISWLKEMLDNGSWEKVPEVIVISDSETNKLLVYDGNVRTSFTFEHELDLQVKTITNQQELNDYLKENPGCWFRITNFSELLEVMRIYANHPGEGSYLAPKFRTIIENKIIKQSDSHRQELAQTFGWTDD